MTWIDVKDLLPPVGQEIVCIARHDKLFISTDKEENRIKFKNGNWLAWSDKDSKWRIFFYWFPLPERNVTTGGR